MRGEVLAAVLWAAMIFALSSVPHLESGLPQDFLLRKILHAVEFGVFTFLLWRVFARRGIRGVSGRAAALLLALLYAFSDELHQAVVPGRDGNLRDVGIDALGILGSLFFLRDLREHKE